MCRVYIYIESKQLRKTSLNRSRTTLADMRICISHDRNIAFAILVLWIQIPCNLFTKLTILYKALVLEAMYTTYSRSVVVVYCHVKSKSSVTPGLVNIGLEHTPLRLDYHHAKAPKQASPVCRTRGKGSRPSDDRLALQAKPRVWEQSREAAQRYPVAKIPGRNDIVITKKKPPSAALKKKPPHQQELQGSIGRSKGEALTLMTDVIKELDAKGPVTFLDSNDDSMCK